MLGGSRYVFGGSRCVLMFFTIGHNDHSLSIEMSPFLCPKIALIPSRACLPQTMD